VACFFKARARQASRSREPALLDVCSEFPVRWARSSLPLVMVPNQHSSLIPDKRPHRASCAPRDRAAMRMAAAPLPNPCCKSHSFHAAEFTHNSRLFAMAVCGPTSMPWLPGCAKRAPQNQAYGRTDSCESHGHIDVFIIVEVPESRTARMFDHNRVDHSFQLFENQHVRGSRSARGASRVFLGAGVFACIRR